jgi:hypothetical protein
MSAEHVIELRFDGRPGEHFTWEELEVTATGLPNQAPVRARTCLQLLVQQFLDPLRRYLKRPIRITSGYRSDKVNRRVHGSKNSRHMTGEAADFKVGAPGGHDLQRDGATLITHDELLEKIEELGLGFDQIIFYAPRRGGHVHVQICAGAPSKHRRQVLWAPASGGYEPYKSDR